MFAILTSPFFLPLVHFSAILAALRANLQPRGCPASGTRNLAAVPQPSLSRCGRCAGKSRISHWYSAAPRCFTKQAIRGASLLYKGIFIRCCAQNTRLGAKSSPIQTIFPAFNQLLGFRLILLHVLPRS